MPSQFSYNHLNNIPLTVINIFQLLNKIFSLTFLSIIQRNLYNMTSFITFSHCNIYNFENTRHCHLYYQLWNSQLYHIEHHFSMISTSVLIPDTCLSLRCVQPCYSSKIHQLQHGLHFLTLKLKLPDVSSLQQGIKYLKQFCSYMQLWPSCKYKSHVLGNLCCKFNIT